MASVLIDYLPASPAFRSMPPQTKIWIYQANKPIPREAIPIVKDVLSRFAESWTSHNHKLNAYADVLLDRFVILAADETRTGIGGCSIDSSVRFIRQLGEQLRIDFLDRQTFAWLEDGEVHTAPQETFEKYYQQGRINDETLVFDNLVNTKEAFEKGWIKPLGKSWHHKLVSKN